MRQPPHTRDTRAVAMAAAGPGDGVMMALPHTATGMQSLYLFVIPANFTRKIQARRRKRI